MSMRRTFNKKWPLRFALELHRHSRHILEPERNLLVSEHVSVGNWDPMISFLQLAPFFYCGCTPIWYERYKYYFRISPSLTDAYSDGIKPCLLCYPETNGGRNATVSSESSANQQSFIDILPQASRLKPRDNSIRSPASSSLSKNKYWTIPQNNNLLSLPFASATSYSVNSLSPRL